MRCAQNADGHSLQLARRCPRLLTHDTWRHACDVTKDTPERPQTPPPGLQSDICDGQFAVSQQRNGPFNSSSQEISMRRNAKCILERSCEVRFGNATDFCQSRDGPVLMRCSVHPVFRAQQATQQPRVLICKVRKSTDL